ncbi:hypothetical protein ACWDYH_07340 [Nocardia goodfellowii]
MAHIRRLTLAAMPLTMVLLARPGVAGADPLPPWLPIGEIVTGSTEPGSADPSGSASGSGLEGSAMELGPPAAGVQLGAGSGANGFPAPAVADGDYPAAAIPDAPMSADDGMEIIHNEPTVVAEEPGGLPQADSGSVRSACAGGLAVGSALILLGSATGSGPGYGLIGVGSSGSGTGSAAVGSAAVGSAVTGSALICLLWPLDGAPPAPGIPLDLEPPAPALPAGPAPDATAAPTPIIASPPVLLIDLPEMPAAPKVMGTPLAASPLTTDPVALNLLQLMTILVIAILSAVRSVAAVRRKHGR